MQTAIQAAFAEAQKNAPKESSKDAGGITNKEKIWRWLRLHPNCTGTEIQKGLGMLERAVYNSLRSGLDYRPPCFTKKGNKPARYTAVGAGVFPKVDKLTQERLQKAWAGRKEQAAKDRQLKAAGLAPVPTNSKKLQQEANQIAATIQAGHPTPPAPAEVTGIPAPKPTKAKTRVAQAQSYETGLPVLSPQTAMPGTTQVIDLDTLDLESCLLGSLRRLKARLDNLLK